jgi:hypothetical protein
MRTVSPERILSTGSLSIGYQPQLTVSGRDGTKWSGLERLLRVRRLARRNAGREGQDGEARAEHAARHRAPALSVLR